MLGSTTVGLVHPEGVARFNAIQDDMERAGFYVEALRPCHWDTRERTSWHVDNLFPAAPEPVRKAIADDFLEGGMGLALLVTGENAVSRFREFVGFHVNPLECATHTIRYRHADYQFLDLGGGYRFYRCVISCSPSRERMLIQRRILFGQSCG